MPGASRPICDVPVRGLPPRHLLRVERVGLERRCERGEVILHFLVGVVLGSGLHLVVKAGLDLLRLLLRETELAHERQHVPGVVLLVVRLVATLRLFPLLPVSVQLVDELGALLRA